MTLYASDKMRECSCGLAALRTVSRIYYCIIQALVSPRPKILIIDDDTSHLKLYSWILERGGFVPTTVLVSLTGVELPQEQQFDLVLLDYRFSSSITAIEVAYRIKQNWPGTPIVILSDMMWMPDDIAHLVDGFIHKGDPEGFVDRINQILKQAQA